MIGGIPVDSSQRLNLQAPRYWVWVLNLLILCWCRILVEIYYKFILYLSQHYSFEKLHPYFAHSTLKTHTKKEANYTGISLDLTCRCLIPTMIHFKQITRLKRQIQTRVATNQYIKKLFNSKAINILKRKRNFNILTLKFVESSLSSVNF